MTNKEIGLRIKYARDLQDTTLDDVAKTVGVAKSTVQRYENGKIKTIKLPVVESIANALGVNPAWIIGKSDEMKAPVQNTSFIMDCYNLLNEQGKQEAEKRVRELTQLSVYTENHDVENAKLQHTTRTLHYYNGLKQHFTNVQEALDYIKQEASLVAAFNGKTENEDAIIQMANAIYDNRTKE